MKNAITRHGANKFGYVEVNSQISIVFEKRGPAYPLHDSPAHSRRDSRSLKIAVNRYKTVRVPPVEARKRWRQSIDQRLRALLNVIKFKLVAIDEGVSTFEDEFLTHTLLPDGDPVRA